MRIEISDEDLLTIKSLMLEGRVLETGGSLVDALRGLRDMMLDTYGPVVTVVLFYRLGMAYADKMIEVLRCIDMDDADLAAALAAIGVAEDVSVRREGGDLVIAVRNLIDESMDAPLVDGECSGAGCYFTKGFIERFVELAYGVKGAIAREVKCVLRGDGRCEFVVAVR